MPDPLVLDQEKGDEVGCEPDRGGNHARDEGVALFGDDEEICVGRSQISALNVTRKAWKMWLTSGISADQILTGKVLRDRREDGAESSSQIHSLEAIQVGRVSVLPMGQG